MKSSSLLLKIALIFTMGCDSVAMCNKGDLFVRSSLQQEVSAPGLLLHWFKNKQQVPLAGLPCQRQARNILYKEALSQSFEGPTLMELIDASTTCVKH